MQSHPPLMRQVMSVLVQAESGIVQACQTNNLLAHKSRKHGIRRVCAESDGGWLHSLGAAAKAEK